MKLPIHLETRDVKGNRLVSPSSERNSAAIGTHLAEYLPANANVLEIASGTGQHGHHMCGLRSDIVWQPSDIDRQSRASQNAYAQDYPERMRESIEIDVTEGGWWTPFPEATQMFCANMIHIAPLEAAEGLALGAGKLLKNRGSLYLYGPFLLGDQSASSNLQFDQNLKKRNPEWGVRELEFVKHMFADHGLVFETAIEMPRNNFLLKFNA